MALCMVPLSWLNPFWRIRTKSGMPYYHSITQNQIFAKTISIWGKPINIYFYTIRLQNGVSSLFRMIHKIDIQSSKCFFFYNIKVQKKTWNECTCRSILRNFLLYDSTLHDLRSAFDHYLSLGTCALVKQYAKHFHA